MQPEMYKLYKPLRNHLRPVAIENGLSVIWAYINLMQLSDFKIPIDIEIPTELIKNKKSIHRGIYEWELALLAKELIIHGCDSDAFGKKDFRKYSYFANAVNKLKDFENRAWPIFGDKENVLREMGRVARRQFPWNVDIEFSIFLRYFKIYNNSRISKMVEGRIGLSIQKWYTVSTVMFGAMTTHVKMNIDPEIKVAGITKGDFDKFISYASADIGTLRNKIKEDPVTDDQYVYSFNPLEFYPIVKIGNYYYCPVTTFLVWRLTSGIYFDLDQRDGDFRREFGLAFQDYILEVSKKIIKKVKIIPEVKYKVGKSEKDSIDLILTDDNSAIFVEAKTKRLSAKSKSEFVKDESILKDLGILADSILQVYETIIEFERGLYPHIQYKKEIRIFPMVVTLEEWFIFGIDAERLKTILIGKMKSKQISLDYLEKMPYIIISTMMYEVFVQILNHNSIEKVMTTWFTPDKKDHNFGQFLIQEYKGQFKHLSDYFPGDFEKIYPEGLIRDNKN